jgi:Fe-S-cluster containining protein
MNPELRSSLDKSKAQSKEIKSFLQKNRKNKQLDSWFHQGHQEVFQTLDCLDCANCCKTTSPIFRDADIRRIAKHLRMKEAAFVEQYLRLDEDHDFVLQHSPCSFLGHDNHCSIYEHRPLACREYPHTDRKNMHQILKITEQNTQICPAVAKIIDRLMT